MILSRSRQNSCCFLSCKTFTEQKKVQLRILKIIFLTVVLSSPLVLIYEASKVCNIQMNEKIPHAMGCECTHKSIVDNFYKKRASWKLSKLGAMLYKNEHPKTSEEKNNKTFLILIWKFYKALAARHVLRYSDLWHDPLSDCSVTNCKFTGRDEAMNFADAVVVHLHRGQLPSQENRSRRQKWIFLNDESPHGVFTLARPKNITRLRLEHLHNVFNWSMMYRSNSDVPVPYGRTVPLKEPMYSFPDPPIANLVPYWRCKRSLVAIVMSNCALKHRQKIIANLRKYIEVDFYGSCGDTNLKGICPGHYGQDCEILSRYLFYFALEGARCKEYITEKVFHHAYYKGAIPIIQGPSIQDCEKHLPPNSYLHLDNYIALKDLAEDIIKISGDRNELLKYHKWRNHFQVLNEHGYSGTRSYHLCRVCEAMNYNDDNESIYSELKIRQFLGTKMSCRNYDVHK